jgi:hypothetical protein
MQLVRARGNSAAKILKIGIFGLKNLASRVEYKDAPEVECWIFTEDVE